MKRRVWLFILAVAVIALTITATWALLFPAKEEAPCNGFSFSGFRVGQEGSNWTVLVVTIVSGRLPDKMFIRILASEGNVSLQSTPWSNLTMARWPSYHVLYDDRHPRFATVCDGDRLLIDRLSYPQGSRIEISSDLAVMGTATLQ